MAAWVELNYTWGDTTTWELLLRNEVTGDPQNLDAGTTRLAAKLEEADAAPLFELTEGNGITKLAQAGATLGKAHVKLEGADLGSLPNGYRTLLFDVEFTDTGPNPDEPKTPIRGVIRVRPRIGT